MSTSAEDPKKAQALASVSRLQNVEEAGQGGDVMELEQVFGYVFAHR